MKLCVDCKHYSTEGTFVKHMCTRPRSTTNLVTGEKSGKEISCESERAKVNFLAPWGNRFCGGPGIFFEKKPCVQKVQVPFSLDEIKTCTVAIYGRLKAIRDAERGDSIPGIRSAAALAEEYLDKAMDMVETNFKWNEE